MGTLSTLSRLVRKVVDQVQVFEKTHLEQVFAQVQGTFADQLCLAEDSPPPKHVETGEESKAREATHLLLRFAYAYRHSLANTFSVHCFSCMWVASMSDIDIYPTCSCGLSSVYLQFWNDFRYFFCVDCLATPAEDIRSSVV